MVMMLPCSLVRKDKKDCITCADDVAIIFYSKKLEYKPGTKQ